MHHYSKTCISLVHHPILVSLVSFELKVFVLGFLRDHFICKSLREIFSSEGYHLRGCSRVGYLSKKCKRCLEPKVQEGELKP